MENGVSKKLHELPMYTAYVKNEQSVKDDIKYKFMMRELIPWKLTCDQMEDNSRN
jgi:hypothetical protein